MNKFPMRGAEPIDDGGIVHRFVAPNPGPKTLQGTNSYVVGRRQVYLIDPGPDDAEHLADMVDWIHRTGRSAHGILLTHGHPDHAMGAAALSVALSVPIWAADTEPYPLYAAPAHDRLPADAAMTVATDRLRAMPTPGHTPDSVSYFLEGAGILFTGDTILGQGSTIIAPPEGDMTAYMASLHLLQRLPARLLAPGHGPTVVEAGAKIHEYIEHRRARESQLVTALAGGSSTVPSLVARLYADTPPELRALAEGSITAGLQKLESEKVVQQDGEFWSLLSMDRQ